MREESRSLRKKRSKIDEWLEQREIDEEVEVWKRGY